MVLKSPGDALSFQEGNGSCGDYFLSVRYHDYSFPFPFNVRDVVDTRVYPCRRHVATSAIFPLLTYCTYCVATFREDPLVATIETVKTKGVRQSTSTIQW